MIEPSTSVATSRDAPPLVSLSVSFDCAHCHTAGTTSRGALWRVAPPPEPGALYYLHTRCLDPYKAAHGLRSVEGRLPLTDTRARLAHRARRFTPTAPAARIADRSIAP